MSIPGLGAMIHSLGGGSERSAKDYYGRMITAVSFKDDRISLTFDDGVTIFITDEGQSCCESRYMTMDDNIEDLVGGHLMEILVKSTETEDENYETHEIAFLEIQTDLASVTAAFHNEHNGYYGGFGLNIDEEGKAA